MTGMRVIVLGGSGNLGGHVLAALRVDGHEAVGASRRTGVDIATGAGLGAVMVGADAVVHCADTLRPWEFGRVTVGGTRAVAKAMAGLDEPPHLVYISIVGVDRHPSRYYRAKFAAEMELRAAGIPATVVRATQFHSLVAAMARAHVGPLGVGVAGFRAQPVDIAWVGRRLAEIATGPAPDGFARHPDLAGPEVLDAATVADLVAAHEGRTVTRRLDLPPIGRTLRAFAGGAVLPGPDAETGGESFAQWLDAQPDRLPRR